MINRQKAYWNKVASDKRFTTSLDRDLFQSLVPKEAHIVDYGCGYGRTLNELYGMGYTRLTGFDLAEEMIARGKRQFPRLDLRVTHDNKIDCETASVDVVLLFAVLTCIISDTAQRALIKEIFRVLRPGGLLYVNDFLINDDDRNRRRYQKYSSKYGKYGVFELEEGALLRHHTKSHLDELLTGFHCLHDQKTIFTTMNGNISNGFLYLGRKS